MWKQPIALMLSSVILTLGGLTSGLQQTDPLIDAAAEPVEQLAAVLTEIESIRAQVSTVELHGRVMPAPRYVREIRLPDGGWIRLTVSAGSPPYESEYARPRVDVERIYPPPG